MQDLTSQTGKFLRVLREIYSEIFGEKWNETLDDFKLKFTKGIPIPQPIKAEFTDETLYVSPFEIKRKFISSKYLKSRLNKDGFLFPTEKIESPEDFIKKYKRIQYYLGTELFDKTQETDRSTRVYNSSRVYQSLNIIRCKNILFSYSINDAEYLAASQESARCNFGIRTFNCNDCSSTFEVCSSWKIRQSYIINNCVDLSDCIMCSHINSKQYCVANMQYSKDEFEEIKRIFLKHRIWEKYIE